MPPLCAVSTCQVTINVDGSVAGVGDAANRPRSYLDYTQLWYHMIEAPYTKVELICVESHGCVSQP